jgi:hypothetical protein
MALALGFISAFDFATFAGWVSFVMLGLIPMQIVIAVTWGANPAFAAGLRQPSKGVVLIVMTMIAAAVVAPLILQTIGEGVSPPGPIPTHYAIIVVVTTFWLAIMMGGWPFTAMIKNPIAAGLVLLVASYVITYLVFRVFYNYGFLQGAPVYLASAPQGAFNAVSALVFYVTALAVMFVVLCFDLWPLTTAPAIMKQPVLGVVWTVSVLVVAAIVWQIGVAGMGTDPMVFLTRVTVPVIFGTIIVLNMLQNSLYANLKQPIKGVMNTVTAIVIGAVLATIYRALSPVVTGALPSGAPGYEQDIWLANALLSVTFPFLVYYAAFLGFWPLVGHSAPSREAART